VASVQARIGWKALTADEYVADGYVFLATPNIKADDIDFGNVNFITQFRYEESPELKLQINDVLLVKDGNTLGITNLVRSLPRPATVNGSIAVLRTTSMHPAFLRYVLASDLIQGRIQAYRAGMGVPHLFQADIRKFPLPEPPFPMQRAIADYLDAEISALDNLLAKKQRLVELLQERIDSAIMELVGQSAVVEGHRLGALPTRRRLAKLDRPPEPDAAVITAFRDGQVTARSLRRSEGFTESWTEGARVQGVLRGDVVVHGLDGFAGAIGRSESDGVCSPVYHVCSPIDGGDADFYGRMLRLLATTGYLGNFASSTRERAVDFRNWDLFGRIPIPVVEPAEQRRIGDRIRRLAPIRERVHRSEVLINERKHALITGAVTGQIEIPRAAA
jgi:type I restriction enzyme S subunit